MSSGIVYSLREDLHQRPSSCLPGEVRVQLKNERGLGRWVEEAVLHRRPCISAVDHSRPAWLHDGANAMVYGVVGKPPGRENRLPWGEGQGPFLCLLQQLR